MSSKVLSLECISEGMSISHTQIITDEKVRLFAQISGDFNPIHLDDDFAQKSRFKKRIAHGLISGSLFSSIFGTQLPGSGCVYTAQSFNFKRPVYIGDEVSATVTVTGVNLKNRRITFETICTVRNKIVIDGNAEIYLP